MEAVLAKFSSVGYSALMFVLILSIVVFIHELGHFLVARWHDIKVEQFAIGIGPEIIGFNDRAGTRWKVCAFPIGGYVQMHDENLMPNEKKPKNNKDSVSNDNEGGQITAIQDNAETTVTDSGSYYSKTPWQRIQVCYAGPLFNYLLTFGILVFMGITFGLNTKTNKGIVIAEVVESSGAAKAKLQAGDIIKQFNGHAVYNLGEYTTMMKPLLVAEQAPDINLKVARGEQLLEIQVKATKVNNNKWQLGLQLADTTKKEKLNFTNSVQRAFMVCVNNTVLYAKLIADMFKNGVGKNLMGPLGIAQASGKIKIYDIEKVLSFIAAISLSLGFFNLLPIPPLDGGNAVVFFSEIFVGSRASQKIHEVLVIVGLVLIGMLMLWTLGQDVMRLLF